jgi:hypothetical protein
MHCLITPIFALLIVSGFMLPSEGHAEASTECISVSGAIAGNVTGADPVTVLGTVTGDLAGATAATITKQHVFVTNERHSLRTVDKATWIPVPGKSGVFHMSTQYTIQGGTGKFKNAKGTLENHGEADTNRGLVTLGYSGQICGVSR